MKPRIRFEGSAILAMGVALLVTLAMTRAEAQEALAPAVGRLLIARASLPDPNFNDTAILLLAHGENEGALGVVLNRRSRLIVSESLPAVELFARRKDPLYLGGPVSPGTLIVLIETKDAPAGASEVLPDIYLLETDQGLKDAMGQEPTPDRVRFFAGYAGWSAGQLEREIDEGVWGLLPGDSRWIFSDRPKELWERLTTILYGPRA